MVYKGYIKKKGEKCVCGNIITKLHRAYCSPACANQNRYKNTKFKKKICRACDKEYISKSISQKVIFKGIVV